VTARPEALALYGPVADDLPRVEELLASLQEVEFPWLRDMLGSVLEVQGKRLRPAIALLSGRLGAYDLELLAPLAASVELLHTATLVHDDVIDQAEERRGRPTAAALFNNAPSVMLGDYMFAHAAEFVARTGNIRVIRNFADTLRVMARGELSQDQAAYEYSPDVSRYFDRIYGKTASLFATAAENGAIVSGAPEACIEPARRDERGARQAGGVGPAGRDAHAPGAALPRALPDRQPDPPRVLRFAAAREPAARDRGDPGVRADRGVAGDGARFRRGGTSRPRRVASRRPARHARGVGRLCDRAPLVGRCRDGQAAGLDGAGGRGRRCAAAARRGSLAAALAARGLEAAPSSGAGALDPRTDLDLRALGGGDLLG
jgi:hypothetical protein